MKQPSLLATRLSMQSQPLIHDGLNLPILVSIVIEYHLGYGCRRYGRCIGIDSVFRFAFEKGITYACLQK